MISKQFLRSTQSRFTHSEHNTIRQSSKKITIMPALTTITIPTPEPYSKNDATRNQENLAYVQLQILSVAKTNGEAVAVNLTDVVQAVQDLQFNGQILDFGNLQIRLEGKVQGIGV
jgi:hypothetical protein